MSVKGADGGSVACHGNTGAVRGTDRPLRPTGSGEVKERGLVGVVFEKLFEPVVEGAFHLEDHLGPIQQTERQP